MRASLDALLDEYAGLASRLARMQADVAVVTGSARSADGGISAVVDPNGKLVRLSIDDPARLVDSQTLAAQIVEVVRRAAIDARERVGAMVSEALPEFEGALRADGTLDVTRLLPPVRGRGGRRVSPMWVDPVALREAAPTFGALAASVDDILVNLSVVLDTEGDCWGRDRTGVAFAQSYVVGAQQTRAAFLGLYDAMRGVGRAVSAVADGTDAAESQVQSRFGRGGGGPDAGGSGL